MASEKQRVELHIKDNFRLHFNYCDHNSNGTSYCGSISVADFSVYRVDKLNRNYMLFEPDFQELGYQIILDTFADWLINYEPKASSRLEPHTYACFMAGTVGDGNLTGNILLHIERNIPTGTAFKDSWVWNTSIIRHTNPDHAPYNPSILGMFYLEKA